MKTQLAYCSFGKTLRRKLHLKTPLGFLFLFLFVFPAYSQNEKTSLGSVDAFYESLKPSRARMSSDAKKSIKVKNHESVNISIKSNSQSNTGEVFTGKVEGTKTSYVYFNYKDGSMNGKVIMPEQKKAYKYYSEEGNLWVVPEDIEKAICTEYQHAEASFGEISGAPTADSWAYTLQSLPGATAVVMLDFDGHDATGSYWGDIIAEPANVTEQDIEEAWKVVSEDFRPFQLNITTDEAVYQAAPSNRRMRCIITPTTDAAPGWGGVAFIGSFNSGGELSPCWVFNIGGGKLEGETSSHEIGHTVGLRHDGRNVPGENPETYFGGHENWGPIMGVSYYKEISHWSQGEYQFANNIEDDITIIATQNGFDFRQDPQGGSIGTSGVLTYSSNGIVIDSLNRGVINNSTDVDYYAFTTTGGNVNLTVSQASEHPNLDIVALLYDQLGSVIGTSNPPGIEVTGFNINLPAGTYYIRVEGTGFNDPFTNGYSDYSSIGEYTISGTINNGVENEIPVAAITSPENGAVFSGSSVTIPIEATASDTDGSVVLVEFYNGTQLLGSDNSAPYSFIYENVMEGSYTFIAVATDDQGFRGTSNPVTVNVTNPIGINGPSCVISGQPNAFHVNLETTNFHSISWWTTGDAMVQQDPTDPKKATIYLGPWNSPVEIRAGISYTSYPYYAEFFKQIQVNNCGAAALKTAANDPARSNSEISTVTVFDLNGREVSTGKTSNPDTYINDQSLPSGLYLMQVVTEYDSYMKKVLK